MNAEVMRTIKRLLPIVLETVEKVPSHDFYGLCGLVLEMHFSGEISRKERYILEQYFRAKVKPKKFLHFGPLRMSVDPNISGYWWPRRDKKPRIRFLKALIKLENDSL